MFIAADMTLFALLFMVFSQEKAAQPSHFEAAQALLGRWGGLVNTLVLLTSSLFVARFIQLLKGGDRPAARSMLGRAIICGMLFVLAKVTDYVVILTSPMPESTLSFFGYYFVLTGIHLLHLVGGLTALMFIRHKLMEEDDFFARVHVCESVAAYWHMVDLLWIMIFPLFYLIR